MKFILAMFVVLASVSCGRNESEPKSTSVPIKELASRYELSVGDSLIVTFDGDSSADHSPRISTSEKLILSMDSHHIKLIGERVGEEEIVMDYSEIIPEGRTYRTLIVVK